MSKDWKFETLSVHAGYSPEPTTRAVAPPIYQTVAYAFDSAQHGADLFDLKVPGNIYTRINNPTQDVLEQRVAALGEGDRRLEDVGQPPGAPTGEQSQPRTERTRDHGREQAGAGDDLDPAGPHRLDRGGRLGRLP